MKIPLYLLFAAALVVAPLTSRAQVAPKILVVDLAKLFDGHWKTKEQMEKIRADETKAQDHAAAIQKEGDTLVAQFKELDEQTKNPASTVEAKAKAQADAQKLYGQIQQKQSELNSFAQDTQNSLRQRTQAFKTLMIEEISKAAVTIANQKGATFLFDKSGPTMVGVSNILYSDPALDITDEVKVVLEKDAPVSSGSAPAATTDSASPQITVPGISPTK
jgi:outer membrane protein